MLYLIKQGGKYLSEDVAADGYISFEDEKSKALRFKNKEAAFRFGSKYMQGDWEIVEA